MKPEFRQQSFYYLRSLSVLHPELATSIPGLETFINRVVHKPESLELSDIYVSAAMALFRKALKSDTESTTSLLEFQRLLLGELEFLLSSYPTDSRHEFLIVIPVADRPEMLENCLLSLLEHWHDFSYRAAGCFTGDDAGPGRIRAMVVDDSLDPANRRRNREIARIMRVKGLGCAYLGLKEQGALLARLGRKEQLALRSVIGARLADNTAPPHKGASITRNIALLQLASEFRSGRIGGNTLVWFVDSDEEFKVRLPDMETGVFSYFHLLDRLFRERPIDMLTGRVVGDPPVCPSIMVNNFMDDLLLFLHCCLETGPHEPCPFHENGRRGGRAAVYNDMVELFGYKTSARPVEYSCPHGGEHALREGFISFASGLQGFFHGRHPTREILFDNGEPVDQPVPGRTVYTGNYIFRSSMLKYFIPYAGLGLRMAGPTFGRLLMSRVGERFVTANIPLLHRRTLKDNSISEFRHGITENVGPLDLSDQLSRQFWGDVMLFTVEQLAGDGYPGCRMGGSVVRSVLEKTALDIREKYRQVHAEVGEKARTASGILDDKQHWWNTSDGYMSSVKAIRNFLDTVNNNFAVDSEGPVKLAEEMESGEKMDKLVSAIMALHDEEFLWQEVAGIETTADETVSEKLGAKDS